MRAAAVSAASATRMLSGVSRWIGEDPDAVADLLLEWFALSSPSEVHMLRGGSKKKAKSFRNCRRILTKGTLAARAALHVRLR